MYYKKDFKIKEKYMTCFVTSLTKIYKAIAILTDV